jgi:hypothetical protein
MFDMKKIDKLLIGDEFLETAINLFLDEKKYLSALHLAGASEEVYGKWLRCNGSQDYSNFMLDQTGNIFKEHGIEIDKKSVKDFDKHSKNTIKHLDGINDRYALLNPEIDSFIQITEAIMNHSFLKRDESVNIKRFKNYIVESQGRRMR